MLGEVEFIAPLHPSRPREVTLVRLGEEQYVLKSKAAPAGLLGKWRLRAFGHADIAHEARIYRALERQKPVCFRSPRLIATDARHFLLLEYMPTKGGRVRDGATMSAVARAIVEFQKCLLDYRAHPLRHALHRYQGIISIGRFLWSSRKLLPPGTVGRCLRCVARLHRQQPALPRSFIVHNDLNPENLARGASGQLILLDFAAVARVRRWLFGDVVAYGFNGKQEYWIAPALVAAYVAEVEASPAFAGVRPEAQLRMALIAKVLHWISYRSEHRRPHERGVGFLRDVLLSDETYARWYSDLLRQGRADLEDTAL